MHGRILFDSCPNYSRLILEQIVPNLPSVPKCPHPVTAKFLFFTLTCFSEFFHFTEIIKTIHFNGSIKKFFNIQRSNKGFLQYLIHYQFRRIYHIVCFRTQLRTICFEFAAHKLIQFLWFVAANYTFNLTIVHHQIGYCLCELIDSCLTFCYLFSLFSLRNFPKLPKKYFLLKRTLYLYACANIDVIPQTTFPRGTFPLYKPTPNCCVYLYVNATLSFITHGVYHENIFVWCLCVVHISYIKLSGTTLLEKPHLSTVSNQRTSFILHFLKHREVSIL